MKKISALIMTTIIFFTFCGFTPQTIDVRTVAINAMLDEVITREGTEGFDYELVPSNIGASVTTFSQESQPVGYVVVGTKESNDGSVVKEFIEPFVLDKNTGEATNAFLYAQKLSQSGITPYSDGWLSSTADSITLKYQAYYTTYYGYRQLYVPDKVSAYYSSSGGAFVRELHATFQIRGDLYSRSTDQLVERYFVQTASVGKSNPSNGTIYSGSFNWNNANGIYITGFSQATGYGASGVCWIKYSYNGTSRELRINNNAHGDIYIFGPA